MSFVVTPVSLPGYLAGVENGKLPLDLLYPVVGGGKLAAHAAWYWAVLVNECANAGVTLTYTGTYRTYTQQVTLFLNRYTTTYIHGASSKVWNGIRYYLRPGNAGAAVPGTSNHGLGIAIDMSLGGFGLAAQPITPYALDVVQWINAANDLGFSWEGDPTSSGFEQWHIRHARGS